MAKRTPNCSASVWRRNFWTQAPDACSNSRVAPLVDAGSNASAAAPASRPLEGKAIVLTRTADQSRDLTARLGALGAEAILLPMVSFGTGNLPELDAALWRLSQFQWILFTSQNAVRFFHERLQTLGLIADFAEWTGSVAAIGEATRQSASEKGIAVRFVAKKSSSAGLAAELAPALKGCAVLWPRGDQAEPDFARALREVCMDVSDVIAYRNQPPESADPATLDRLRRGDVSAIVFASPSAFKHLARFIPAVELAELSLRLAFAAIGPTTARALRDACTRVSIESAEATTAALADAISKYFARTAAATAAQAPRPS
ncbi:MAG: uroporphyrinogen-III synthase [Candidatus Acidiferrales bacterium]